MRNMKKMTYLTMLLVALLAASCSKDEIGGTATEALAGEWYVTVDCVDEAGNVVYTGEEFFGLGRFIVWTYNTADNVPTEMWIDDQANFWDFKVKLDVDVNALTFSTNGYAPNQAYDSGVSISGGKIVRNGGTQNNGSPADYIEFYLSFDDDDYPEYYGYAKYKVSGVRYSGLAEND